MMENTPEYHFDERTFDVIRCSSLRELTETVNARRVDGWVPQGGIAVEHKLVGPAGQESARWIQVFYLMAIVRDSETSVSSGVVVDLSQVGQIGTYLGYLSGKDDE